MNDKYTLLWFSNIRLTDAAMTSTGTWISSMIDGLQKSNSGLSIINVTQGNVYGVISEFVNGIKQWVLPLSNNHISYPEYRCKDILQIIEIEKPDIIHVWGTEAYWGAIPFNKFFPHIPVLLDIQGVMPSVVDNFYGELTSRDLIKCFSLKEFLKPQASLFSLKRIYRQKAKREELICKSINNISVQSEWVLSQISSYIIHSRFFKTKIALRKEFYTAGKWINKSSNVIFTTASAISPLKGLLTMLKAFKIVHSLYPKIVLHVASPIQQGIRECGYSKFIKKFIRGNNLQNSVIFVGELDADALINELQNCAVFVNPSNIESYSLVLAEAMYIGVPSVASYVGAIPELGKEDVSVLFFGKNDANMCAYQIIRCLNDKSLSNKLSENAIKIAEQRNNLNDVIETQLQIYYQLLSSKSNSKC